MSQHIHIDDNSDGFTITPPLSADGVTALQDFAARDQPRGRRGWPDSTQCAWTVEVTDHGTVLVPAQSADRDFEEWLQTLIDYFFRGGDHHPVGVPTCTDFTEPRTLNGRMRIWGEYDGLRDIEVLDNTVTIRHLNPHTGQD
ncbi:hypothetical protein ACL02S_23465 [Nocardia sp. 004]|uniref:hypothetical protein n=1 Tax=Nocardia sp. 004 TaxID=3385978 RepID=UPI0039A09F00